MNCLGENEVHVFIDGEFEGDRHEAVLEHLSGCAVCQRRVAETRTFLESMSTILSKERCPEGLRAKILCRRSSPRHRVPAWTFLAASLLIAAFLVDPVCLRGCPTVHALTQEHSSPTKLSVEGEEEQILAAASRVIELPALSECDGFGLRCEGAKEVLCGDGGCLVRYLDKSGGSISFIRVRGAQFHPWLRFREQNGLVVTEQDGCKVVGWTDAKSYLSAFVAPKETDEKKLVALAAKVRG